MKNGLPARWWGRVLWLTLSFTVVAALVGYLRHRLSHARSQQTSQPSSFTLDLQGFQGLSESEALERQSPLVAQKREQEARRVRRDIWRLRTFSIFNVSRLAAAAVRVLLGDPLGAWLTLGILILNMVLNVDQQLMATQRLEKLMAQTRPQAEAIRDGRIRSIELDEIVTDDLLVIGPGDEFVASGEIREGRPEVAEVNVVSGEDTGVLKERGDLIQAGILVSDRPYHSA